jgi:two-component system, LuxR family, response regulator FixJ
MVPDQKKESPMASHRHIHVIDPDFRRRARITFELAHRNLHAEIYEDLEEFGSRVPDRGAIFVADEPGRCSAGEVRAMLDALGRPLPVAVYSADPSPERIVEAMLGGALDYLRWPFDPALLETALARLSDEGERRAQRARRGASAKAAIDHLSVREHEVLELMIEGDSNKEIGRRLGISPRTVEIHRGNMMRKLNARSTSDAVRLAMYAGLDATTEDECLAA